MQTKWQALVVLLIVIAGAGGYWFGHRSNNTVESNLFTQKPLIPIEAEQTISVATAQQLREEYYQGINTISEILSLPSLFAQQEALYMIGGRADKIQLQLLIRDAAAVADAQQRAMLLQILVVRLTEIDPQTAANIALDAYQNKDYSLLHHVYQHWGKLNLEAAINSANKIKDSYQQSTAAQGVLAAISVSDVQQAMEVSKRLGIETSEEQYVGNALVEKAIQDPESALQEAMLMPQGYERDSALQGVIDAWAKQDPRQAFAYVERITDNRARLQLQETILYRWAESNPQAAYEIMLTLPKGRTSNVNYTILTNIANQNPREALNLIENISSSRNRVDAYNATIQTWAAKDARAEANFVSQIDNKQLRQQLAPTVIQYLSTESPDDALIFARELDPNGQMYLQDTVIGQIAGTNPERAFQLAQSAEQATVRQQLMVTVVNNLSYQDPPRAAAMIDQVPSAEITPEIINSVVYNWANSDPDAAMAWVNSKSGQLRNDGLISIGSQLANVDPDLAASYLPQLNGQVRESWAQNITYNYSSYDLAEAVTWIENFRGKSIYNNLLSSVVSQAATTDVDYALQLAQNTSNAEQRNGLLRQIADQISYSDPQRAESLYSRLPVEDRPQ
jgi:hypothetical protein